MTTTMYLRNRDEVAVANRAAKELGYKTNAREFFENDRYVCNIVARLAGSLSDQRELEDAIVRAVSEIRSVE